MNKKCLKRKLISLDSVEDRTSPPPPGRNREKRGKTSVTKRMLDERDAQLDGEENACGQKAIWRHVYDSMKCGL